MILPLVNILIPSLVAMLLVNEARATCYYPFVCTRYTSADGHTFCSRSGRATCEDTEAHEECRSALHEDTDMINSMGRLADEHLEAAHEDGMVTARQLALGSI